MKHKVVPYSSHQMLVDFFLITSCAKSLILNDLLYTRIMLTEIYFALKKLFKHYFYCNSNPQGSTPPKKTDNSEKNGMQNEYLEKYLKHYQFYQREKHP